MTNTARVSSIIAGSHTPRSRAAVLPFAGVHAQQVGAGVAASIFATAEQVDGPDSWVHLCITAAEEASAAVLDAQPSQRPEEGMLTEPCVVGSARKVLEAVLPLWRNGSEDQPPLCEVLGMYPSDDNGIRHALKATMADTAIGRLYAHQPRRSKQGDSEAAHAAASAAYRCCLPPITNRRSVQSFVACVAVGMLRRYISGKDATALLYAAQAALSAFPKRKPRKEGTAK